MFLVHFEALIVLKQHGTRIFVKKCIFALPGGGMCPGIVDMKMLGLNS